MTLRELQQVVERVAPSEIAPVGERHAGVSLCGCASCVAHQPWRRMLRTPAALGVMTRSRCGRCFQFKQVKKGLCASCAKQS